MERLKVITLRMAFTEAELRRLHAKATENCLDLDEYVNDVIRKQLDETKRPDAH